MSDINEIMAGLDRISERLTNLETDRVSAKAFAEKAQELGAKQADLARELLEIRQKNEAVPAKAEAKSVGDSFVADKAYTDFVSGAATSARAVITLDKGSNSTPTTVGTSGPAATSLAPSFYAGVFGTPNVPQKIEPLIPHIAVTTDSVDYVTVADTIGAAGVAEAGAIPESKFTPTLAKANVVNVAHYTKITKQLADDAPALAAYINTKMLYGLQNKVENQIVNGDGTAPQLKGLLATGSFTDASAQLTGAKNLFDLLLLLQGVAETAAYEPEALVLNPMTWAQLAMEKDSQGRYLLGGPGLAANKSVWGIPVVTSSAVPAGKFIFGNFTQTVTIYDRQQVAVEMTGTNEDDFTHYLYTIRASRRLALAVEVPAGIFAGDFKVSEPSSGKD
ncbi:MAG: phage major capsid protein [Succinivibrionaceae bacterium]|nr:phage major capsid protein [Succinivibrionaceae bacterium]